MIKQLVASSEACPFCGSNALAAAEVTGFDAPTGTNSEFRIMECLNCIAAWQFPLVRPEELSVEVFERAYTETRSGYFAPEKRKAIAVMQEMLINAECTVGSILDIGCGDGTLVRSMYGRGWRAIGIDPAMPAGVVASSDDGRLVLSRGTTAVLPQGELFDVITLWDVVEHLEEPHHVIQDAASRLAPGGLLIVETGNYQSSGRIEAGPAWWNYQFDHRWYLAPPQLSELMQSAGLSVQRVHDAVLRPWWRGNCQSSPPSLRPMLRALPKGPTAFAEAVRRYRALALARRCWPLWSGLEIMTMLARKPA